MSDNVISLVQRAPVTVNQEQMGEWGNDWSDMLTSGEYGEIKRIAIVVQTEEGQIGVVSQATAPLDGLTLSALLGAAAHYVLDNRAGIDRLKLDPEELAELRSRQAKEQPDGS